MYWCESSCGYYMTFDEYRALVKEKKRLLNELDKVKQQLCPEEGGHKFKAHVEWAWSGQKCEICSLEIKELCHYVGCKCLLNHHETNVNKE